MLLLLAVFSAARVVGLRTVLRNLMLVANASSAVVGFAVLGLAAALHVGERPEAHVAAGGRTLTLTPTLTLTLTLTLALALALTLTRTPTLTLTGGTLAA